MQKAGRGGSATIRSSRAVTRAFRDGQGRWSIEDLGSANGTFMNGVRISEPQALQVGDAVRVGRTTLG